MQTHPRETAPRPLALTVWNPGARTSIRRGVVKLESEEKQIFKKNSSASSLWATGLRRKGCRHLLRIQRLRVLLAKSAPLWRGAGREVCSLQSSHWQASDREMDTLDLTWCHPTLNFSLVLFHLGQLIIWLWFGIPHRPGYRKKMCTGCSHTKNPRPWNGNRNSSILILSQ